MSSRHAPDPRVDALLLHHGTKGEEPARLIEQLCHELLNEAGAGVPVNLDVLASFQNAKVRIADQEHAETIVWDGQHFVIRVREADTRGRQRFSLAHGIVHTYFYQASPVGGPGRAHVRQAQWSEQEEQLCDQGAAELLLPRAAFKAHCPDQPTMDDVLALADAFEASAEATALRVVRLSRVPAAMVVLEPGLKPVEKRQLANIHSPSALLGFPAPSLPTPRLRVHYSYSIGQGVRFIPKHKSVDQTTPLADVLHDGMVDYVGETGLIPGEFRVSARRLPIRRDGVLIDRVVMLLFDPRAASGSQQLRRPA